MAQPPTSQCFFGETIWSSMFHGFPWHRPQVAVTWEGILGKVKSEERLRALADPGWMSQ